MTEFLDLGLKVASFGLSIAAMVYAFIMSRRKDVDERFASGAKRMGEIEAELSSLKHVVDTLPTKEEFHAMQLQLSEMGGLLREMRALMQGNRDVMTRMERIVERHEEHLLDNAK